MTAVPRVDPLSVACPHCGAPEGVLCQEAGRPRMGRPHRNRHRDAALAVLTAMFKRTGK